MDITAQARAAQARAAQAQWRTRDDIGFKVFVPFHSSESE